jgi:hypothetical protein
MLVPADMDFAYRATLGNPTDREIVTCGHSPDHAPQFGGLSFSAKLPPGDSRRFPIRPKE